MIIAHLPAGYLLMKTMSSRFERSRAKSLWVCGLAASVLPDTDIFYFYFVKYFLGGSPSNHRYFITHWPLFWLALLGSTAALFVWLKRPSLAAYPKVLLAGVSLHLVLDIVAAPIYYLAPFSWEPVQLIRIPAVYGWWVMNFLRHWVFWLELGICGLAAAVWLAGLYLQLKKSAEEEEFEPNRPRTLERLRTLNRPKIIARPKIYTVTQVRAAATQWVLPDRF